MTEAPAGDQFPAYPVSWYLFGKASELRDGPRSREMLGRRLVAFRTVGGRLVVLDARCAHLGADLGRGRVVGEAIQCPFHNWEYGVDGGCTRIPASGQIPEFARQTCYPVAERHGLVFFFNGPRPLFPLPFFAGCAPDDLVAGQPFEAELDCPWFMVGANAFDLQHFQAAHDRRLTGIQGVDCPAPYARRATGTFLVASDSVLDRLTRWLAGDRVQMSITDWCGNLMFATATFRRTRSYGMVATRPLETGGVLVQVIVFVRRSRSRLGRVCLDPLHLALRRYFIREFLRADAERLAGVRYNPRGLIECDRAMAEYFDWLARASHGVAQSVTRSHGPGGADGDPGAVHCGNGAFSNQGET